MFKYLAYAFYNPFMPAKKERKIQHVFSLFLKRKAKRLEIYPTLQCRKLEVVSCNDAIAIFAFIRGLKKNKNKELGISPYLNPPEDFNSTMARAMDYMLDDEALYSVEEEEQISSLKQHKKGRGENH